jgi:hypothetical protein
MLKSQAFWIGVLVGLILMYVYSAKFKGKGMPGS